MQIDLHDSELSSRSRLDPDSEDMPPKNARLLLIGPKKQKREEIKLGPLKKIDLDLEGAQDLEKKVQRSVLP